MRLVDGFQLRLALKTHELRRDAAIKQFQDSLMAFPGETKPAPTTLDTTIAEAERAIVQLQVAQMRYNLNVLVEVGTERMTLAAAIKEVGGWGRAEKRWRSAMPADRPRAGRLYASREQSRSKDAEHASPTLPQEQVLQGAHTATRIAAKYRAAIAKGNAKSVPVGEIGLDPELLE